MAIKGIQDQNAIRVEFRDHIGPGANRATRPILPTARRGKSARVGNDTGSPRHLAFQRQIRRLIDEANGMAIHHLHAFKAREAATRNLRGTRGWFLAKRTTAPHPIRAKGKHNIFSRKGIAIMESHVPPQ